MFKPPLDAQIMLLYKRTLSPRETQIEDHGSWEAQTNKETYLLKRAGPLSLSPATKRYVLVHTPSCINFYKKSTEAVYVGSGNDSD